MERRACFEIILEQLEHIHLWLCDLLLLYFIVVFWTKRGTPILIQMTHVNIIKVQIIDVKCFSVCSISIDKALKGIHEKLIGVSVRKMCLLLRGSQVEAIRLVALGGFFSDGLP